MVTPSGNVRYIEAVEFKGKRQPIRSAAPKLRMADPTVLRVEPSYQRDLSPKSHRLIQKIIAEWDWAKFKPPVCAQTDGGLFVIDGQHTAIAAASHPEVKDIPILIVEAAEVERRAEAFVAHNRDRVAMTPAQIFHGEVAAGVARAVGALAAVTRGGGSVPRSQVGREYAKPGQITAVGEMLVIHAAHGPEVLERVVRIAVLSKIVPTNKTVIGAIRYLLTDADNDSVKLADSKIAGALASINNFEDEAQIRGIEIGAGRSKGGAELLAERLRAPR